MIEFVFDESSEWDNCIIQEILLPEWYDEKLAEAYPDMPHRVSIDDFNPIEIPAKIGYIVQGEIYPKRSKMRNL